MSVNGVKTEFVVGKKYIHQGGIVYECTAVTTSGRPVMKHGNLEFLTGEEYIHRYTEYVEKKKRTLWVNIYPPGEISRAHSSRHYADHFASYNRLACIEISWEEGQGL